MHDMHQIVDGVVLHVLPIAGWFLAMDIEVQKDLVSELQRAHEGTGGVESKVTTTTRRRSPSSHNSGSPRSRFVQHSYPFIWGLAGRLLGWLWRIVVVRKSGVNIG